MHSATQVLRFLRPIDLSTTTRSRRRSLVGFVDVIAALGAAPAPQAGIVVPTFACRASLPQRASTRSPGAASILRAASPPPAAGSGIRTDGAPAAPEPRTGVLRFERRTGVIRTPASLPGATSMRNAASLPYWARP